MTTFERIHKWLFELNLFDNGLNEVEVVRQQRWSTRLYLVLLFSALIILVAYTAFGDHLVNVTVKNPSQATFEALQLKYPNTINCPCSKFTITYESFVQINATFHQICSSSFVTDAWILTTYKANVTHIWPMDVRTVASAHAQLLRSFCELSRESVSYNLIAFLTSPLVSSQVLSLTRLQLQVNIQVNEIQSTGNLHLIYSVDFIRLVTLSAQSMSGLGTNAFAYIAGSSNGSLTMASGKANAYAYQLNDSTEACYCLLSNNCPLPGAIYSTPEYPTFGVYNLEDLANSSISIKGIQVGCYALEGVLASTLECYFDTSCFHLLVSGDSTAFAPLNSTQPSQYLPNTTVNDILTQLMIEQWLVSVSYAKYYSQCALSTCTYSFIERNSALLVFTTLIALFGGLNVLLQMLVPWIVQIITKWKQRRYANAIQNVATNLVDAPTSLSKAKAALLWMWTQMKAFNLFDTDSHNPMVEKRERQSTRLYIISLSVAFAILVFYTILTEETLTYTVQNPSLATYEKLQANYPNTIECSCTRITVLYSTFLSFNYTLHQSCSSQFISPAFIEQLALIKETPLYTSDFMQFSVSYFEWLATFCSLSNDNVNNYYQQFKNTLFVNAELLDPISFNSQAQLLVKSLVNHVRSSFTQDITLTREVLGTTQPLSATQNSYSLPIISSSSEKVQISVEPSGFSECSCVLNPTNCSDEAAFYSYDVVNDSFHLLWSVMGVRVACSPLESFLQSNLACWYSPVCYETVVEFWQNRTYGLSSPPPLLNQTIESQYTPTTLLLAMVGQSMLETWSTHVNYSSYFAECNPNQCTYSITQRRNIAFLVATLVALFGGLNVAIKLLVPIFVRFAIWLIRHEDGYLNTFRRVRELPYGFINLNVFYNRHKSSELTLGQEKRSTRVYLLLLITSLTVLVFYNTLAQQTSTVTIQQPTQQVYEQLLQSQGESSLKCPCSSISTLYENFVQVTTTYNVVCSSVYVQDSWIESIFNNGHWSNLSKNEFRGRGVLYFLGLRSFCTLSQTNITSSTYSFLTSSFISDQLLPEAQVIDNVNSTIEQLTQATSSYRIQLYHCIRQLSHENQIMNIYSLNWVYSAIPNFDIGQPIPTEPVSYGQNCSCATSFSCTQPIMVDGQTIPGFVIGCNPTESLFRSTLVCLYNQTCVDQINLGHLPVTALPTPSSSLLSLNRTVEDLVDNLFDEQWFVNVSYSDYFKQCQPSTCFYKVTKRNDALEIIVTLLGLYGGLTEALCFIVPKMFSVGYEIVLKFKRRQQNRVSSNATAN